MRNLSHLFTWHLQMYW